MDDQIKTLRDALERAEVALLNCQNTSDQYVYTLAGKAAKEARAALDATDQEPA